MTTEHEPQPTRVTYVGHGTVLVEMDGVRILTDPSLKRWTGALRRYGPLPMPPCAIAWTLCSSRTCTSTTWTRPR